MSASVKSYLSQYLASAAILLGYLSQMTGMGWRTSSYSGIVPWTDASTYARLKLCVSYEVRSGQPLLM